jgi:hypothetical protein
VSLIGWPNICGRVLLVFFFKNSKILFEEKCRRELNASENIKIFFNPVNCEVLVLTNQNGTKIINILTFTDESSTQKIETIDLTSQITDYPYSLIEKCVFTHQSGLLCLIIDLRLYFLNKAGAVLKMENMSANEMNVEYFLSPTNVSVNSFHSLTPISHTDSFVMLDNLDNLHLVAYDLNKNEIKSSKTNKLQVDSFAVNKNLLLAYDKKKFRLVCFNVLALRWFELVNFSIELSKQEELNQFGFSLDNKYVFSVHDKKIFRLYRIEETRAEQIAELFLYAQVTRVLCTSDFVSFSMRDRKVVSYLINDKQNAAKTTQRLKDLSKWYEPEREMRKKNELISTKNLDVYEDSSEEELDIEQVLDEKNQKFKNIRDKIRNCRLFC